MKMHSGDLQRMVRHGGVVPQQSEEERAALPAVDCVLRAAAKQKLKPRWDRSGEVGVGRAGEKYW